MCLSPNILTQEIGWKFARSTTKFVTMEDDAFKKELIKNFIDQGKHPRETTVHVTKLLEKIKRVDQKKG